MDPAIERYLAHATRFTAVVEGVDAAGEGGWASPSPCEEWTAADVVAHVVDTQRDFFAARDLPLGPRPEGHPGEVWSAHLAAEEAIVADDALVTAPYDGYFGPTTLGETLADFYGFDLLVHRWDLGRATGQEVLLDDAELDAVETALDGFGDALYAEGICRPAVPLEAGASRQDRLLARTGRRG